MQATPGTRGSPRDRAERSRLRQSAAGPEHGLVLRLVTLSAGDPAVPRLDDPGVEVWRDVAGTVSAVSFPHGSSHCLYVPRIGTFTFASSSDQIQLVPVAGAHDGLIDDAFHRIALPIALQLHGPQVLHGSAVLTDNGVVALCGRASAGKSTMAFAMHQRGHVLWADDAVAFCVLGDRVEAKPLPFRMRLRPESANWFDAPELLKGSELQSPWLEAATAATLRAVILLDPCRDSDLPDGLNMDRLAPGDAFRKLLPHAYYVSLTDESLNRRLVTSYLELADRLPVFSLRYDPQLELVDRMCDVVERHVSAA